MAAYGGKDREKQADLIHDVSCLDILISTPGRTLDFLLSGVINLSKTTMFVLDEADRMLDMGFEKDIRQIAEHLVYNRNENKESENQVSWDKLRTQNILLSATFMARLRKVVHSLNLMINTPVTVCVQGCTDAVRVVDWEQGASDLDGRPVALLGDRHDGDDSSNSKFNRWKMVREHNVSLLPDPDGDESHASGVSANVKQVVQVCAEHKKPRKLIRFIEKVREEDKINERRNASAILIFCTKIKTVTFVQKFLQDRNGITTAALHSHIVCRFFSFLCS